LWNEIAIRFKLGMQTDNSQVAANGGQILPRLHDPVRPVGISWLMFTVQLSLRYTDSTDKCRFNTRHTLTQLT